MEAAERLAGEGLDITVVNCRFIKPLDRTMLEAVVGSSRLLVTVEDGIAVNGFGAYVSGIVQELDAEVRVAVMGAPDRTFEHASRAHQLAEAGLTADGIAERVRAWMVKESLSTT